MHNKDMISAAQIKETRMALGESQAAFGQRFGVDQSTVHRWETDSPPRRGPGLKALEALISSRQAAEQGAAE